MDRYNPDLPITVHNVAVGDRVGSAHPSAQPDPGHSAIACEGGSGPRVAMATLDAAFAEGRQNPMRALKIDVEGAELRVLEGARRVLTELRPLVVCELVGANLHRFGDSTQDLYGLLRSLGYDARDLPGAWTPTILAWPAGTA